MNGKKKSEIAVIVLLGLELGDLKINVADL